MIEEAYPFQRHIGFRKTQWSAQGCRVELDLEPFHSNRHGVPHGGLLATLLDTALGYAGCWTGSDEVQLCVTLNLTTNYIGAVRGKRLIAEGQRTGGGRKIFFASGTIHDETGALIADATGAFRYIQKK